MVKEICSDHLSNASGFAEWLCPDVKVSKHVSWKIFFFEAVCTALKNFNEDAIVNNIQNNYDSSVVNSQINYQFNSIEKIIELYERLLDTERKKNELLESFLRRDD